MAITRLSLATSEKRKDKDGNRKESTDWHRVTFFGKLAEIVSQYVTKGSQICVIGRIKYGSYDKDGVKHYTTDIIGDEMQILGGKGQRSEQQKTEKEFDPRTDGFDENIPF